MPRKKTPGCNAPDNVPASGDWSVIKAGLQESLERGRADRVETQALIMDGSLCLRGIFKSAIGGFYAVYRNQILEFDASHGSIVSALLGIPESQTHNVRKIISELTYDMTGAIKEGMEEFVKNS